MIPGFISVALVNILVEVGMVMYGPVCLCFGNYAYSSQFTCLLSLPCDTVVLRHVIVCARVCVSVVALELVSLAYTLGDAVEDRMSQDVTSLLISLNLLPSS